MELPSDVQTSLNSTEEFGSEQGKFIKNGEDSINCTSFNVNKSFKRKKSWSLAYNSQIDQNEKVENFFSLNTVSGQ